jgi:hypothetical protein
MFESEEPSRDVDGLNRSYLFNKYLSIQATVILTVRSLAARYEALNDPNDAL